MGVVAMEVTDVFHSRGYPHVSRAVYVYCDACGSFDIRTTMSGKQISIVIGGFLFVAALLYFSVGAPTIFILTLVYILIVSYLWGSPDYVCQKCSTLTTIEMNTRRYPSDKSVVDVPEEQIVKLYLGYWPDMTGELEEYLMPPEEKPKDKT